MEAKYRSKEIVWAKIEPYPWWPGKIINIHIQFDQIVYKILFFADPTYAYLQQEQLCSYPHFDPKCNAKHPPNLRLTKAIKMADEAFSKTQPTPPAQPQKIPLSHKKSTAKSSQQSLFQQRKQLQDNIRNFKQASQLPQLTEHQTINNIQIMEGFRCEQAATISPSPEPQETVFKFEQITKENIIDILSSREQQQSRMGSGNDDRRQIIRHKLHLKKILLERYNLHQIYPSKQQNQPIKISKASTSEEENRKIKGFRKYKIQRRNRFENMHHLKQKSIRKIYHLSKHLLAPHLQHLNLKDYSLSLMKRISQLSQENEIKYKSLVVAFLKSFQGQERSRPLDQRLSDFNVYLQRLQNEKQEDEEGSKMTQISTQN